MKKEGLILGLAAAVSILATNLISAYGSYGNFGFTSLINTADPLQMLSFAAVFIIIFALVRIGLGHSLFKNSLTGGITAVGNVVSAAVTFLIIYWGFYQTNFSLAGSLSNVGLSSNILYIILGIIFLVGMIYIIRKTGFGGFLIMFGVTIVAITFFTTWIYEKGAALVIGIILILTGLGVWRHSRKFLKSNYSGSGLKKNRSKYELFFFGIAVLIFGEIGSNGAIFLGGVIITAIGLLWWIFTRRKAREFATSPETYKRPSQWVGNKYNQMTDSRYKLAAYEKKAADAKNKEIAALKLQQARAQEEEEKEMAKRKLAYLKSQKQVEKIRQQAIQRERQQDQAMKKEIENRISQANSKIMDLKKLYDNTNPNDPAGKIRRERIGGAIEKLEEYIDSLKRG